MTSTDPAAARHRNTRQRDAIRSALAGGDFRTAQEIHDQLRLGGESIGLATVYRTLQSIAEAGEVDVLRTPDGRTAYRRCSSAHHHHLICRDCGRTVEVDAPAVEAWLATLGLAYGFSDVDHELVLYGRCSDC